MARYLIYAAFCAAILCAQPQPASSAAPSGQNNKAYQRDKDGALVPRMNYATFLDRSYRFVLHDLSWTKARARTLKWILDGPVKTMRWNGFYEDVGPEKRAATALEPSGGLPLPGDCPIDRSPEFSGIVLTGQHVQYGNADTWYPSWAADGNLYSPWTDGYLLEGTEGRQQVPFDEKHPADACNSVDFLGRKAATAQAKIVGDDPRHLKIINLPPRIDASPMPYEGRYPCGSLVYNDVWYYGTYALTNNKKSDCGGVGWTLLGPFVGFRWSTDFGKTWTETHCTPARPLFGEDPKRAPVKIGSPHFVDFGRNMEHSPDGYAYLVAHGSTRTEAWNNWIQGDQVYLLRVKPSIQTMNDAAAYEFFAGRDAGGKPIWSKSFAAIKPLLEWKDNLGCVTATYNAGLKKYLMCVSRSVRVQHANAIFLESSDLTGPWRAVAYLKDFGPENYFLNIPSKFISQDGRSFWLCHSGNWSGHVETGGNPPGSHYALCLREFRLVSRTEEKGDSPRLPVPTQYGPTTSIAAPTSDAGEGFSSPFLKVVFATNRPNLGFLGVDSLGKGKVDQNIMSKEMVPPVVYHTTRSTTADQVTIAYTRNMAASRAEWELTATQKTLRFVGGTLSRFWLLPPSRHRDQGTADRLSEQVWLGGGLEQHHPATRHRIVAPH